MASAARAVLLDIDGTLVDSNYLHVDAWVRALRESGLEVDAWRVHRAIGMGADQLLDDVAGPRVDPVRDAVKDRHTELYLGSSSLLRTFARAPELLRALAGRGWEVVLATSAAPDELAELKRVLDPGDEVSAIVSGHDVEGGAKPEPDLVHVALERAGVPAGRAVFVGDSVWDVEASRRAGVATVGVLSGGTSRAELTEAGAVAVYRDAAELLAELDGSLLA